MPRFGRFIPSAVGLCTVALVVGACAPSDAAGTEDTDGSSSGSTSGPASMSGPTSGDGSQGESTSDSGDPSTTGPQTSGDPSSSTSGTLPDTTSTSSTDDTGEPCIPDCSRTECGPDPVCGEECGSCEGQDACEGGVCVCQPACDGLECGPDGCGGECGTCDTGECTDGICVECQADETQCISGEITQIRTCDANSKWQLEACPEFSACIQGTCEPVCDGHLANQMVPSVCVFPVEDEVNQGTFVISNDVTLLEPGSTFDVTVQDEFNNDTPIYATEGTDWPWAWSMIGSQEVATVSFRLTDFTPPITHSRLYWRGRRTGLVQTSYPSRYAFSASNGSIFASGTHYASYVWTNHFFETSGSDVEQYSPTEWNFNMLYSVGDGFGHQTDEVEISWMLFEIQD